MKLICEIKITEQEGVELTDEQRTHIVEGMKLWLQCHLPHSKLVHWEGTFVTTKKAGEK